MSDPIRAVLEKRAGRALIPFVTAGHPVPDATGEVLLGLDAAGAAVIELGLPFSDSLADGPVIQASYHRAIRAGMTVERALGQLREVSRSLSAPVVLMGAVNPILALGLPRFLALARRAGAAGILVPDLPPEEAGPARRAAADAGLAWIALAAPTTPYERYRSLCRGAGGFVYQISRTGTTGVRAGRLDRDLGPRVEWARKVSKLPVALGFGISDRTQVRQALALADAAVVGSALVEHLDGARSAKAAAARAAEFLAGLDPAREE